MLNNKKILVTGGNGFLGKHVVNMLTSEYGANQQDIFVPKRDEYDLRKEDKLRSLFEKFSPEIVIHLATTSGGMPYYKNHPGESFYTNLIMGTQLMEVARLNNVKRVAIAGSALGYPKDSPIPLKEEDFWKGYPGEIEASYGLAHKMLSAQATFYKKEYGFNIDYLILPNLYGPGYPFKSQHPHVIPSLINKFYEAKINNYSEIKMWDSGTNSREFMFVKDAARFILDSLGKDDLPNPINIGPGTESSIKDLAVKIKSIINFDGKIVWNDDAKSGSSRRALDSSKSLNIFGKRKMFSLEDGLEMTIKDFLEQNR